MLRESAPLPVFNFCNYFISNTLSDVFYSLVYRSFMDAERVVSPPAVTQQLQYMLKEQELLNNRRLDLVNQLR